MAKNLPAVLLGILICWAFGNHFDRRATADAPGNKSASLKVAIVDMARVYNTSKFLQKERDGLKAKLTEIQEAAQKLAKEVQELNQKWKTTEPGSEDRKELEVRLKRKQTEMLEYQNNANMKFVKDQANIYLATYRKAIPEIATYAQEHEIDLVLQNQPEPVDENDPVKLLQSLNRSVLYENKLDITEEIISALAEQ